MSPHLGVEYPSREGEGRLKRSVRAIDVCRVLSPIRAPREPFYFRSVLSRNYYAAERRARHGEGARESVGRSVACSGTETKKALVCFCTCASSRPRMQKIGRAPQSERNLQTQFPGQTDRRTDRRRRTRANREPLAHQYRGHRSGCTETGCGFNNASP